MLQNKTDYDNVWIYEVWKNNLIANLPKTKFFWKTK